MNAGGDIFTNFEVKKFMKRPNEQSVTAWDQHGRSISSKFYLTCGGLMVIFNGNFNHAIMIRTFLSKNHQLHYQAGAGIVNSSTEEDELQEVYNKLGALNKALELAETI